MRLHILLGPYWCVCVCACVRTVRNETEPATMSSSPEANRLPAGQEISYFLHNPNVHQCIHKCLPNVPNLSQIDSVYAPTSPSVKIHQNIILPSTHISSMWFLSLRFNHQKIVDTSLHLYLPHALPINFFSI